MEHGNFSGQRSTSIPFRLAAFGVAGLMFFSSTSTVLAAAVNASLEAAQRAQRAGRAPAKTKPMLPKRNIPNLGRDAQRSCWWTPELRELAIQKRLSSAVSGNAFTGALVASIDPSPYIASVLLNGFGSSWSAGPAIPGEVAVPTGGGAIQTNVNTNTGNLFGTFPITSWNGRGSTSLNFDLFHNSQGSTASEFGESWTHSFNASVFWQSGTPNAAILTMPTGLEVPYTKVSGVWTPAAGWFAQLTQNSGGTWTLQFKDQGKYEFNTSGLLTQVKDRTGNAVTISRLTNGQVSSASTPDGRTISFDYESTNKIQKITAPGGRTWRFTYDSNDFMIGANIPKYGAAKSTMVMSYSNGALTQETDPNTETWYWSYDTNNRAEQATNPNSEDTTIAYHTTYTEVQYPEWVYPAEYGIGGGLTWYVQLPDSSPNYVWSYNANRQPTAWLDANGVYTSAGYDSMGNMTSYTDGEGEVWQYNYNSTNDLTWSKDPLLNQTTYNYFTSGAQIGLLKEVIDPLLRKSVEFTRNSEGEVTTVKDDLGRTTTMTRDTLTGLVEKVTDPAGVEFDYTHDAYGNVLTSEDGSNNLTTYEYDDRNLLVRTIYPVTTKNGIQIPALPAGPAETSATYDDLGNMLTSTDELNRTSTWTYDNSGRTATYTNPRGDVESYTYVGNNVYDITNGNGKLIKHRYTDGGRLDSIEHADGITETFGYDGVGNRTAYGSGNGYFNLYELDDNYNLTKVDYPTGTDTTFTYDDAGRKTTMVDVTGTTTWSYNNASEVTSLVQPQGAMAYTYNTAGQRTVATEVGLGALTNVYDGTNGRLMTQTNRFSETTTYAYDSAGRVQRKTLHNGQYEEYTYDQRNRVMTMNLYPSGGGTPLRVEDYTLDAASQVTKLISGPQTTFYTYDNHSQLTREQGTAGVVFDHNYTYDNNGNRLTRNDGTNSDVYTYDDGDKLLNVKRNTNNWREYAYDNAGNTTSRKKWISGAWQTESLTYDWQDRMVTQAIAGGADAEHAYNGVNTRVATGELGKSPNNVFARDGVGVTAPVMRDSNAAYTPGTSERRGSTTTYLHSGIKNANAQTSTSGSVTATRTYDAFGNTVASTGTWKGPFGYAGQFGYQEDASGLKLLGNRYYDAEIGRFITKDPIKDGRNWYAYCDNNPVKRIDAEGLGWHNPMSVYVSPYFKGKVWVVGELTEGGEQVVIELKPGESSPAGMDVDYVTIVYPDGRTERKFLMGLGYLLTDPKAPEYAEIGSDGSVSAPGVVYDIVDSYFLGKIDSAKKRKVPKGVEPLKGRPRKQKSEYFWDLPFKWVPKDHSPTSWGIRF